jgi:hypothetical protein
LFRLRHRAVITAPLDHEHPLLSGEHCVAKPDVVDDSAVRRIASGGSRGCSPPEAAETARAIT